MILASRVMKARRESLCLLCWQPIRVGQQIGKAPIGWCHTSCIIDRALVTAVLSLDRTVPGTSLRP
jgi:hypothetical protein